MKFEWCGETYSVTFRHDIPQNKNRRLARTICNIEQRVEWDGKPEFEVVATGTAFCDLWCDKYEKEKGRRISLQRALVDMGLERDERQIVFNLYENRRNPSREVVSVDLSLLYDNDSTKEAVAV